jgi:hypothetical protein
MSVRKAERDGKAEQSSGRLRRSTEVVVDLVAFLLIKPLAIRTEDHPSESS